MSRNIRIIVALVLAIFVAVLVYNSGKNVSKTVFVPVLKATVQERTIITAAMLSDKAMDEKVLTDLPVVIDKNALIGKVALRTLYANVPIMNGELVEPGQLFFDESQSNLFATFELSKLGAPKMPYGFSYGRINICLFTTNVEYLSKFANGLPPEEKAALIMSGMICPVKYLPAIGLTNDNALPATYVKYNVDSKKYTYPTDPTKLGVWVADEEQMKFLTNLLYRPLINGDFKLVFVLPPQNPAPNTMPTEITNIFNIEPYSHYGILSNDLLRLGASGVDTQLLEERAKAAGQTVPAAGQPTVAAPAQQPAPVEPQPVPVQ